MSGRHQTRTTTGHYSYVVQHPYQNILIKTSFLHLLRTLSLVLANGFYINLVTIVCSSQYGRTSGTEFLKLMGSIMTMSQRPVDIEAMRAFVIIPLCHFFRKIPEYLLTVTNPFQRALLR